MMGIFYKNYSLLVTQESDARLLDKIFVGSKILSADLNRSILYFNLPFETILKDRQTPKMLFPLSNNSDMRLPQIS
jgi:hypothetical protein